MVPKNMVRFVLIGCGRIGRRHALIIGEFGVLVAVADVDVQKANAFAAEFGATAYTDPALMCYTEAADVAVVASPNGLHASHSIIALRAGLHVLCEKPMAISTADATAMMEVARQEARQLFVVKQNRFNPPVQALKQLLNDGALGRILSVQLNCYWNRDAAYYADTWKGTRLLDGGTLYTQFSHFIDLLIWFFGPIHPKSSILANTLHQGIIEFEDSGVVIFSLGNGAPGCLHFTINAHQQNMEGSITVFGEKGTVKIGGQYLNELEYQMVEGVPPLQLPAGNPANQYGTYTGSMSNHPQVYTNLMAVLNGAAERINSLDDALETVRFIEAVYAGVSL